MLGTGHLLYPFDTGLELDLDGQIRRMVREQPCAEVSHFNQELGGGILRAWLFRFGAGLLEISFPAGSDLNQWARIACQPEGVRLGRPDIRTYCGALVPALLEDARKYAIHTYGERYPDEELFPVFTLPPPESADGFIRKNFRALFGILSAEPRFEEVSDLVLEKEPLANLGYYRDEVILLSRGGGVVASSDAETTLDLLRLAYSQHWSLRGYNFLLDRELDEAQDLLDRVPPFWRVLRMFRQYLHFSREAIAFDKDKLEILLSLGTGAAAGESDWHLRLLGRHLSETFQTEDLRRQVEQKIDRIEQSYANARDFLSTNFMILLEALIVLFFAWEVAVPFLKIRP